MSDVREREMRDPEQHGGSYKTQDPEEDGGSYEAQAGSSAPATQAPTLPSSREQAETGTATSPSPGGGGETETDRRSRTEDGSSGLIQSQKLEYFAGRWDSIQAGFVDDPRRTVEQADRLVAEVIDHLAKMFKDERAKLESQWSGGGKADTEDLRIAMQRYRDFFHTLVGR